MDVAAGEWRVESEIDFLICCDLGQGEKGKVECRAGNGEWKGESWLSTQHSALSGEWGMEMAWNREIGPISAILTSWTDFTRVWPGLTDFTGFRVFNPI
jgi:hypothetical protein